MTTMAYVLKPVLQQQIIQIQARILELRLAEDPDTESIDNLVANVADLRKKLSEIEDI